MFSWTFLITYSIVLYLNVFMRNMDEINDNNNSYKLNSLKKLVLEHKLTGRIDDDYLNKFLIGYEQDELMALKALQNRENFVSKRCKTWLNLKEDRLKVLFKSQVVDVLEDVGNNKQKVVWIRIEKWITSLFTADEILEVAGLLTEIVFFREEENIKCVELIIDMQNASYKHLASISPKFAKSMMHYISDCLPFRMTNIYIIRQPKLFFLIYAIFTPFINEQMKKNIQICGEDFSLLTDNIGHNILPKELSGNTETSHSERWLDVLKEDAVLQQLALSGYKTP